MEICIVGKGSIGLRHANIFSNLGHNIIFFRTFNSTIKSKEINTFEEISKFEILKKKKISLIVICNPTSLHYKTVKRFSKICKNFLVEKPLSNNLNELLLIKLLIKKKKLNIFSGYMMKYDPRIIKIKKILKKQEIIFSEFTWHTFAPKWHPYENFKKSYAFNQKLGGGVIKTCSHEIDLSLFFNGRVKSILALELQKRFENNVEEAVKINVKHINGNYSNINLDFTNKKFRRDFTIFTKKFFIKWDFNKSYILIDYYNKKKTKKIFLNSNLDKFYYVQNSSIVKNIYKKKISNYKKLFETEKSIHFAIKSLKSKKIVELF